MKIIRDAANECGGFRPPSGHLDTQLYPECKGYPTDRDVVKKTVEKRKKSKKKASNDAKTVEAKHGWPVVVEEGSFGKSEWQKWQDGEIGDQEFVEWVLMLKISGFPGLSKDPSVRNGIKKALEEASETEDYATAAQKISAWLSAGVDVHEELFATAKKKSEDWDPNPWAVCTESIGKTEGTTERSEWSEDAKERYERCVQDVKDQQRGKEKKKKKAFNLNEFRKNSRRSK